jgi:hypothetical protein
MAKRRRPKTPKGNWIPATPGVVPPSGWIFGRNSTNGKDYWVDPKTLKESPIRSQLTDEQMDRARRIAVAIKEHHSFTVEKWVENMRRDQNPEGELQTWEAIVDVYLAELAERPSAQAEERHVVYTALVYASFLTEELYEPGNVMSMYPIAKTLPNFDRVMNRFRERRFGAAVMVDDPNIIPIIPLAAFFAPDGLRPNPEFDSRWILHRAKVILAIDSRSNEEVLVFGRRTLEAIVKSNVSKGLALVKIGIDIETDELDRLLALVRLVKGRDDYQAS